ncbi:MAG: fumarate hydratase [Candidatus Methanomethylophilaceae archaeon]|jgi:fumarate hydratase subunit alpha
MIKLPEPLEDVVVNLLRLANTKLPADIGWALEAAAAWETDAVAVSQLGTVMDNSKKAEFLGRPICQDTGLPVFFVRGRFHSGVREQIRAGVARATREIPLRPNTVHPITRENSGDNLGDGMPLIHYEPEDWDFMEITVLPKGAGSENMSRLAMLNPSDGLEGIKDFVLETVTSAGGRPCPPTVVGIGIGGSADRCLALAKEALLADLGASNPDPAMAKLEEDLFTMLNSTGLGPMGLGGDSTVLAVRIRSAHCHTASLPVAVNLNCWAARRATVRIWEDGRTEYSQEGRR